MASQSNPLNPTFEGHIASTLDALLLFEACLSGHLNHVPRRPHDRERQDLIKSGHVFIYEEHASGIKRWTDGVSWSPSRILGNFLIYRELEKPFPPGEKKRALKKKKSPAGGISKPDVHSRPGLSGFSAASALDTASSGKDAERSLIGSLIDSYPFKNEGLVKKTISVTFQGVPHHLVSYYNVNDVMNGRLSTPSKHPNLRNLIPRSELIMSQNFRAPIDEVEYSPDERGGPPTLFASLSNASLSAQDYHGQGGMMQHRQMNLPGYQPVSVSYGSSPYEFHPQSHYISSMSGNMPASLHSSMTATSMSSSAPSSAAPTLSSSMPPTAGPPMAYNPQSQGNYSLDPHKAGRFGSGASLVSEFPRHMPTHDSPRRNSAYGDTQSSDLSSMSLGPVGEGRHAPSAGSYLGQDSYYMSHRPAVMAGQDGHEFSPSRSVKADPEAISADENVAQQYGMEEGGPAWGFDTVGSSQDQQYFGHPGGDTPQQQWPGNGSNTLGRN